jgi:hypothetical protein
MHLLGSLVAALIVATAPTPASAETPTAPTENVSQELPAVPAADEDPRSDVAWAAPTALSAPRGTVTTTLTVPFGAALVGATVGLPAGVEVMATAGLPFMDERHPALWAALIKASVLSRGRFHLALGAGGLGWEDGYVYTRVVGAGPIASFCFEEACRSLVSASVFFGSSFTRGGDEAVSPRDRAALGSLSAVVALTRRLKLVGELHAVSDDRRYRLWVVAVRVPFEHLALDAGVALGAPIGSVSWRF